MAIRILPPDVAGKIAAGEVVERPASVVKELLENALDAGASELRVEIKQGGQRLIRVADNGAGMAADEVELAFQHHATSKLSTADDLFAINTLGFRGEALPSIAAVSQVTLLTRRRSDPAGTQVRIEGGEIRERGPQAAPAGTIVTVENLFFNVPARRKFLKTVATESGLISDIVSQYALAYPERRFVLVIDGRTSFSSPGSGSLYDALIAVYGLDVAKLMLEVPTARDEETGIAVGGYVGGPALHRANRKYISLFVNGRYVRNSLLITALDQAYQGVVPTGRHPVVVLSIEVPPSEVDVNVHPQKQEVKFARSDEVFRVVQRAVRRTLVEKAPVHQFTRPAQPIAVPRTSPRQSEETAPSPVSRPEPDERAIRPRNIPDDWEPAPTRWAAGRLDRRGPAREWQRPSSTESPQPEPEAGQLDLGLPKPREGDYANEESGGNRLPPLRVLGQTLQTYIICEGPDGLYLIDQHTAHERVLLERFRAQRARNAVPSQELLEPLSLELTPQQLALVEEQRETLRRLGFVVEPFGGQVVLVRALPEVVRDHPDPAGAIAEILDGAIADRSELSWEERLVMYAACRGAVKAGDVLTHDEMRDLIRQLEQCDLSRTCAHGRPTVVRLSQAQLEREFGRR